MEQTAMHNVWGEETRGSLGRIANLAIDEMRPVRLAFLLRFALRTYPKFQRFGEFEVCGSSAAAHLKFATSHSTGALCLKNDFDPNEPSAASSGGKCSSMPSVRSSW
jgi:hypothetical protein